MLPLEKRADAYTIKPSAKAPVLSPRSPKVHYRILAISTNGETATICSNMKLLPEGKLSVIDVDATSLRGSIYVGDVLAYDAHDSQFVKPIIVLRSHQSHQYPKQLLAQDEV